MNRLNDLPIRREQIDKPYFMGELETTYRDKLQEYLIASANFAANPNTTRYNALQVAMLAYQKASYDFSMLISENRPL